jgi:hypothetical protein
VANKRITQRGKQYLLDLATGNTAQPLDVDYRLFKTNITPTQDDTDGTYAGTEADFTGYALVRVTGWGASSFAAELALSVASPVLYTVGSPVVTGNNVYGYYACLHGTDHVVWAMRFDGAPLAMSVAGVSIEIVPALTQGSQFS